MIECEEPWLEEMGVSTEDAMRLVRELLERCPGSRKGLARINFCRDIITSGSREIKETSQSVSLRKALEVSLAEKCDRRPRTVYELRYFTERMKKTSIVGMKLRNIKAKDVAAALNEVFTTPSQFAKGRIILHSVFVCGKRHGWCSSNPVEGVLRPRLQEAEITALTLDQVERLLRAAKQPEHLSCAAALGVMLWAGVRPTEAQRLSWEDLDWEDGCIMMPATHSKTGGVRCITILPVLRQWLEQVCRGREKTGRLTPRNWGKRWLTLRKEANVEWQNDVLRHTFASYYLKHFRDLNQLQLEMGHSTLQLLRTRYLNMRGITQDQARLFWDPAWLEVA